MGKMAESIKIVQGGISEPPLIEIDGEELPWFTMGGVGVQVTKNDLTGVTITIPAKRVDLCSVQGS